MSGEPVMYGETGDLKNLVSYVHKRISTVDSNMDRHNENHTKQLKRKKFDIRSSEFNSSKQRVNKVASGLKFGDEVDADYAWFLNFMDEINEHTKSSIEEVSENEDEEDEDDNDPQYSMFLKELTENGKSYKLKVSRNNEAPCFLEYHKQGSSDGCDPPTNLNISNFNNGDKVNSSEDTRDMEIKEKVEYLLNKRRLNREKMKISMLEEGSVKNKVEDHKRVTVDSCYQTFLDGCVSSEYGAFVYEGEQVNYEEKVMCSDSDVLIWDNVKGCSTVNDSQCVTAEKHPSLKKKLMQILRQPYNEEEYEELLEYVEQEKPIRRLLPLRYKTISSVVDDSLTKSVLDDVPPSFRIKLDASRNEPAKALNLLRGFRFWLEHVPNEGAFTPWLDEDCLKVPPSSCTR